MEQLSKKTVAYFYDDEVGRFDPYNPMRPHRVRLTHKLVEGFNLNKYMSVHTPHPASEIDMEMFHADDYVNYLKSIVPGQEDTYLTQLRRFNMAKPGEGDCSPFLGLFEYCQIYSGGSIDGAQALARGDADVAINWAGGAHHAKKAEASGFCFINDIVLAVLNLLTTHQRVLYVDIDIHHGDGVEEAFYLTDRVMAVSFHRYGNYFPGTGALDDIGVGKGKHYSVNVPLLDGMDDESYKFLYEPIMQKVMEMYQPGAIVMCCGADSLAGDRLGCFNLSCEGHSNCIEFLAKFNVPVLVLGGGGYTMRNVSRCWCYETARLMGINPPDSIPDAVRKEYDWFGSNSRLRIDVSNMENLNKQKSLDAIRTRVLENLSKLGAAPSAPIQEVPNMKREKVELEEEMEERGGGTYYENKRVVRPGDESDEEERGDTGAVYEMDYEQQEQQQQQPGGGEGAEEGELPEEGEMGEVEVQHETRQGRRPSLMPLDHLEADATETLDKEDESGPLQGRYAVPSRQYHGTTAGQAGNITYGAGARAEPGQQSTGRQRQEEQQQQQQPPPLGFSSGVEPFTAVAHQHRDVPVGGVPGAFGRGAASSMSAAAGGAGESHDGVAAGVGGAMTSSPTSADGADYAGATNLMSASPYAGGAGAAGAGYDGAIKQYQQQSGDHIPHADE